MKELTAHVELEEPTDNNSGRNRACMKAIAYLTDAYDWFGPRTELVDVTARKGMEGTVDNATYGYFTVEVTHLAPEVPPETEQITYPKT